MVVAVAVIVAVADAVVAGSDVVVAGVAKKTADSFRGY